MSCEDDEFECPDEDSCIPIGYVCDSIIDCNNGADEQNCDSSEEIDLRFLIHCTQIINFFVVCVFSNVIYMDGDTFPLGDGCNNW